MLEGFKRYLGKKFTVVRDNLRGTLRNAIAHLDPEKGDISPDRFDDMIRCEDALVVLRYIARTMLTNYATEQGITL